MFLADVLIRYGTVGALVVFITLGLRDGRSSARVRLALLFCLSAMALLLSTAPEELRMPFALHAAARMIDVTLIPLGWWFCLSLFDDDFRPGWLEWTGFILLAASNMVYRFADLGWIESPRFRVDPYFDLLVLAIIVHLCWKALANRQDDLVEPRRRARLWFALAIGGGTALSVVSENILGDGDQFALMILAAIIAVMVFWAHMWLVRLHPEALLFETIPDRPNLPVKPSIDPRDAVSHSRLLSAMEEDQLYTEHGLTISKLSDRISVPEHQLRALINNGLGYRNFAAFLNNYRLAYAKGVLSDPEQARLPVLTIAMDAGYASLATFNRAFKSTEGKTPTDFRRAALAAPAQS